MSTHKRHGAFLVLPVFVAMLAVLVAPRSGAAEKGKDFESTPQVRAYRTLLKAVDSGDFEGYKRCMAAASAESIDKQAREMKIDSAKIMGMLKALAPTDIKIVSVKVEGSKATLGATGKSMGEVNKGTVNMTLEKGQWKVIDQSWTDAK